VEWALEAAGLTEFRASYPHQLSGGMRRRVALMMTLVVDPKILLMDEPFGALDTHTKTRLHASLLEIWEKTRQTIIFVTHDLMEAITLSDRVIIMSGRPGRVKASYPIRIPRPRDVIKVKDSEEYLGDFREIWRIPGEEFVLLPPRRYHPRRAKKLRISSAICGAASSRAKCPASSRCTSAVATSSPKATAPATVNERSCLPHTTSVGGCRSRRYACHRG
jgi:ABC-type sulfate/molybdate transport systems ATPase subunit